MARKEQQQTDIGTLKERGINCKRLKAMEAKQISDARRDMKDARTFRSVGFLKLAEKQEAIARAQKESASALGSLKKQVCLLK